MNYFLSLKAKNINLKLYFNDYYGYYIGNKSELK